MRRVPRRSLDDDVGQRGWASETSTAHLDDELVFTGQVGLSQLSLGLHGEHQRVFTVGVLAEGLALQLVHRLHLGESCIPQHMLHLVQAEEEERRFRQS